MWDDGSSEEDDIHKRKFEMYYYLHERQYPAVVLLCLTLVGLYGYHLFG